MQSRFVLVVVALFLWWTSATTAAQARPVSLGSASIERFDSVSGQAVSPQDAGSADAQRADEPSGQDDVDTGAPDMPVVPMTDSTPPVSLATMAGPGPYRPSAWPAPHLGVPQRPPSGTTVAG